MGTGGSKESNVYFYEQMFNSGEKEQARETYNHICGGDGPKYGFKKGHLLVSNSYIYIFVGDKIILM